MPVYSPRRTRRYALYPAPSARGFQFLIQRFQPGAIIPQNTVPLWQAGEKLAGEQKLVAIGTVQANNNFFQIGDFGQLIDNLAECRTFKFREQ